MTEPIITKEEFEEREAALAAQREGTAEGAFSKMKLPINGHTVGPFTYFEQGYLIAKSEEELVREERDLYEEKYLSLQDEKNPTPCCAIGVACHYHGFIHGAEAEELRERIEKLIEDSQLTDDDETGIRTYELRLILDEVDARDSVAFLEFTAKDRNATRHPYGEVALNAILIRYEDEVECDVDGERHPFLEALNEAYVAGLGVSEDEKPIVTIRPGDASSHDGPGWYYWDNEYRDEGSVGAFKTHQEAISHAREAGYRIAVHALPAELSDLVKTIRSAIPKSGAGNHSREALLELERRLSQYEADPVIAGRIAVMQLAQERREKSSR